MLRSPADGNLAFSHARILVQPYLKRASDKKLRQKVTEVTTLEDRQLAE
jgi:hypothetical protein